MKKNFITLVILVFIGLNLRAQNVYLEQFGGTGPSNNIICSGPFSPPIMIQLPVVFYNPSLTYVWKYLDETCGYSINPVVVQGSFGNGTTYIAASQTGRYIIEGYDASNTMVLTSLWNYGIIFNLNNIGDICSSGNDICAGGDVYLRFNNGLTWNAFSNYGGEINWQLNGVDIPGATSDQYVPTVPGSYRCRITAPCETTYTDPIAITSSNSFVVNIFGNANICNGGTTQLGVNHNDSYLWSTGETSQFITVSTANTYQVTVTNVNGCSGTASVTTNVDHPLSPVISASGPTTFCVGQSVELTASNYGTSSYYYWKRNGSTVGGGATHSATSSGVYTFSALNSCGTFTSNSITVTTNSVATITPTLTANGATQRCTGSGLTTLTASPTGPGYLYQWSTNGAAFGPTNVSPVYSTGSTASVRVRISGNCVTGTSAPFQITYFASVPAKPGSITGPANACPYQLGTVYSVAAVTNATGYIWAVPNGAAIVSGQGTTSITVNWGNKFGNISVRSSNPCGNSQPTTKKVSKGSNCRVMDPGISEENEENNFFTLFPNPANDELNIQFSSTENQDFNIEIRDISGKLVHALTGIGVEGNNESRISVATLPEGVYLVFFKNNLIQEVQKIIVQH